MVRAIEIHDFDERRVLTFDLCDVLDALGPQADALDWLVTDYAPVEEHEDTEVGRFCDRVYRAQSADPRGGVRVSASELRSIVARGRQTIDGQFIGIPAKTCAAVESLVDLRAFPVSDAAVVVKAVDSSFWIVITKAEEDLAAVRQRFTDVRESERTLELGYKLGP